MEAIGLSLGRHARHHDAPHDWRAEQQIDRIEPGLTQRGTDSATRTTMAMGSMPQVRDSVDNGAGRGAPTTITTWAGRGRLLADVGNAEPATDLVGENVANLGVSRDGLSGACRRVRP